MWCIWFVINKACYFTKKLLLMTFGTTYVYVVKRILLVELVLVYLSDLFFVLTFLECSQSITRTASLH